MFTKKLKGGDDYHAADDFNYVISIDIVSQKLDDKDEENNLLKDSCEGYSRDLISNHHEYSLLVESKLRSLLTALEFRMNDMPSEQ